MSPTEMDMCVLNENVSDYKKNAVGCGRYCDTPEMCSQGNTEPSSSKENNTSKSISDSDLDSDDLISLFKLAVIFTRGNPFDNRKHWRMRCEFLEANLRMGCVEKINEIDEDAFNDVDVSATAAALVSESKPRARVRFIQVAPCNVDQEKVGEDSEENLLVEEEVDTVCQFGAFSSECTSPSDNDNVMNIANNKRDDQASDLFVPQPAQGDALSCAVNENSDIFVVGGEPTVIGSRHSSSPSLTISPELNQATSGLLDHLAVIPNDTVAPVTEVNNPRPGCFRRVFRRFLRFFQRNQVGVMPAPAQ